jgi:hypothetical protein
VTISIVLTAARHRSQETARGALNGNPANDSEHHQADTVLKASTDDESRRGGNR